MKVFCYFVEPASYTLDLVKNIHERMQIDYCFIKSDTFAFAKNAINRISLDQFSLFHKLHFVFSKFIRHNFIIINGYNNYPFLLTFVLNLFSFNKRFIAIESDTKLSIPANVFKRVIKFVYLFVIFRSKYVLGFAGGNYSHKDLFRYYGMSEDRIFLMPMMVDNQKYYQEIKEFPEVFTFLFVGRLIDSKNVDLLCERFIKSFSDKNARLIIVGGGDNLYNFKKEYLHPKIEFKGSVFGEELIRLYHDSSVFVFPSSLDAWGLVVNEAMSAGLPVIIHKEVGSSCDLINTKDTGMIVSDMQEFENKMQQLYNDSDLLIRLSKNASDLMRNTWNYDLYNKCLQAAIKRVKA